MFGKDVNRGSVKSIVAPIASFALLGVLVVGAVIFGNLVVERADGCRSFGSPAEDDSSTLLVLSDDEDALMLCDVGTETVKYEPPNADNSKALIGKARLRLYNGDEVVLPDSLIGRTEGNDLVQNDLRIFLYKKGEFGEVEGCYGDTYVADDNDEIWSDDPFGVLSDPDAIESCWLEIEDLSE